MKNLFTVIFFITFLPFFIIASIINVPADTSTIQGGISLATNGDIVLVADGTYYENINFKGKAITVASHFLIDGDTTHIDITIINGSQPSHPDSGSVVYFISGEDTTSVLYGLTITGGTGTFVPAGPPPGFPFNIRIGGGIFIAANMGGRITNNIIEQNIISTNDWAAGGGIYSDDPGGNGYSIIADNIIRNNSVSGDVDFIMGGGIGMGGSGRIVKNIITGNICHSNNSLVVGGGVRLWFLDGSQDTTFCLVEDNIISNNKSVSVNGAAYAGGLNSSNTVITLRGNTIANNIVETNVEGFGAAMYLGGLDNSSRIANNRFSGNHHLGSGACYGGALCISNSHPFIFRNIFDNNSADYGGGIYLKTNSQPNFCNNTLVSNSAASTGGGIYSYQCDLLVENSIIWDNSAPNGSQIYLDGAISDIRYSDIQGGWSGPGNINDDPLFCTDTLYCLSDSSPCIDAGHPDSSYNDPEDPNNPGFALWPAMGGLRNDMGAYGGPGSRDIIPGIEKINIANPPAQYFLNQNYPNPFNPTTTIEFSIPKTEFVTLKIYNILGQEVGTLVSDKLTLGNYKYTWDASDFASGIYYYKIQAGSFIQSKKLIIIK